MGSSLPPKEANLFKVIVKSYETKQYKKGLKAADSILKKFPEHGETLSMKGLTLNCMDRKSEAYELVRRGLKNDLKSHVCWHVYGLLYRSDREYREAIKCYRNALRIDPDNIEILRDLSLLQAQMRDLSGFVETRQQLLSLKPNHRMNWIGFAVAHHLNSNSSKAVEVLEAYEGTLEDDYPPENERYEHNEMLLYKISLFEECGMLDRALEEMQKKESKIVDKLSFKEQMASVLFKLGRFDESESIYRSLLFMNPDNYKYFIAVQKCLGLYSDNGQYSAADVERLSALYNSLKEKYAWSSAVKRIPLDFLEGEKFQEAADNYVRPLLTKGVPSLFSDLSPLYEHPGKANILEQLFLKLEDSIRDSGCFPGCPQKEPPSTLLWTLFLISQHYDRRGQYDIALNKIDEAISHTPTVIDLYSVKGKILQHAGNFTAAAALADEARSMDLADRYLNSECVMQMLQADQVGLAEKTAVLFTKDGDQHNNLHDMQCMWYELASGESYYRQGDLGRALKNFLAVEKHYADMTEDQFDFHSYCLRKMTLRAYVSMLKFQDRLHAHEYFHKAAAGAIRRLKRNKRMKQLHLTVQNLARNNMQDQLIWIHMIEDPLAEATKYLKLLQNNSSDSLETHILSFELSMRKQKVLLAFQAVKQLIKLDEDNPDSHRCLIKFFHKINSLPGPVTDSEKLIWNVLEAERPDMRQLHGKSLVEVNRSFLEKHNASLMHRAAGAEMMYLLEPNKKMEAINLIEDSTNITSSGHSLLGPVKTWQIQDCIDVHKLLETVFGDQNVANRWKARCAEYFPYSTYFEGIKSAISTYAIDHSLESPPENGIASNPHLKSKDGEQGSLNGTLHIVDDLSSLSIR
ncbi:N-terminal acetyltransferase A complex auxiliary subunit NAA15 [Zea mays]|uniref:N-terminal acetyltransferase A complex auxiliary subunit NAA15 n=1 Tax=Zea mays TaxID=4577 RepID=A0A3L6FCY7_MAIZE|nr:N-terminal acetyltransferase A complex auxiliary subunit NAA15 [Zea mays]